MTRTAINLINEPNSKVSANIDGEVQFYGRRCINRMPLMLSQVVSGNFYFYDLYGNSDPEYSGFNNRYQLIYDTDFNLQ